MSARTGYLISVTKRLILMTTIALVLVAGLFALTLARGDRFMLSWASFGCGLLGGFVSIQQRLKRLTDEELELLSSSWFQIVLIPIYGGVFALVLYVAFLSKIVEGGVFPHFSSPTFTQPLPTTSDVRNFFSLTYPTTGEDLAKLLFWSFLAGFSERFVPQILQSSEKRTD
jgi:hypothetical protein